RPLPPPSARREGPPRRQPGPKPGAGHPLRRDRARHRALPQSRPRVRPARRRRRRPPPEAGDTFSSVTARNSTGSATKRENASRVFWVRFVFSRFAVEREWRREVGKENVSLVAGLGAARGNGVLDLLLDFGATLTLALDDGLALDALRAPVVGHERW